MVTFTIAAVLLSAVAAALILYCAAAAARRSDADPTLAVYRRQLTEIDDLADRGLLGEAETRAARAEASRRLLAAARSAEPAPAGASQTIRYAVLAGAVIAPLLAAGLYLKFGAPGSPDQPFAGRLTDWKQADPSQLTAPQMAAVLETVVKSRPGEAEPLVFLARAQAASGNLPAAAETMRKATRLEPKQAGLWADLGILLLMQGQGEETAPSGEAFRKALSLDPQNAAARYHLARARIAAGDVDGGLAGWRALLADLPSGAAERQALQQEIDATAKAGHLIAPPPAQPTPAPQQPAQAAPGGDQKAFILSMVQRLAEQLRQDPNDPAGWARLIRSYAVLGEADKMRQAQDQARRQFKGQPDVLKTLDNAASAPQGSQ